MVEGDAAAGELERADARVPIVADPAGGGIVLAGEPEGAAVGRVHVHGRVVAPALAWAAAVVRLRAAAGDEQTLGVVEGVGRVAYQPAGVLDIGKLAGIRHA